MRKLSELKGDEFISVENIYNVITKKDLIQDRGRYIGREIFEAIPDPIPFSWKQLVETFDDEQYDEWAENVLYDLEHDERLDGVAGIIEAIFDKNKGYYQGDPIEFDF